MDKSRENEQWLKVKGLFLLPLTIFVFIACQQSESPYRKPQEFKTEVMLRTTPVKDQGNSSLCWLYTLTAAIETDGIERGDSVHLSPLWLARHYVMEQAERAYFTGEETTLRGTLMDALRLWDTYGMVGYDSFNSVKWLERGDTTAHFTTQDRLVLQGVSPALCKKADRIASAMSKQRRGIKSLRSAIDDLLDREMGYAPRRVFLYSAEYTPLEFAHSCTMASQWNVWTSMPHHDYGKPCVPEMKDNKGRNEAMNVPEDSLRMLIIKSLQAHHPVMWEGAMHPVNTEREHALAHHKLTDDHCMCIIGMGTDGQQREYLILKNSWGADYGTNGMAYIPTDELLKRTMLIATRNE